MNFGHSVGDVVAVGTLAWKVYVSCKDAPASFGRISTEVLSLHAVLKEVKGAMKVQPLPPERQQNLAPIIQGCNGVLEDLQVLVVKYERMNTQSQRTWDRMRYGFEDITELRARVTSNVTMLTAFMSMSQFYVERKLNKLREEFQNGHRQGSAVSEATVDSLTMEDRAAWRAIRKELEDIGISIAAFEANRPFIVKWLQDAIDTNAFEETIDSESSTPGTLDTSPQIEPENIGSFSTKEVGKHSINVNNNSAAKSTEDFASDEVDSAQVTSGRPLNPSPNKSISKKLLYSTNTEKDLPKLKLRVEEIQHPLLHLSSEEIITNSPPATAPGSISRPNRRPFTIYSMVSKMLRYDKELVKAYESGNIVDAEKFLNKGADIDTLNRRGSLTKAVDENDLRNASWLLANGLKFNENHLALATEQGSVEIMQLLIKNGVPLNWSDDRGRNLPALAVSKGQIKAIEVLLESGIAVDQTDVLDQTALHHAARQGSYEVVRFLISKGASLRSKDISGNTPLHNAAASDSVDTASHLVEKGADVNNRNWFDETPVHTAARYGRADIITLLSLKGADVNAPNYQGTRPLHSALSRRHQTSAKVLLRRGAAINQVDIFQNTTLHYAARARWPANVELLVGLGADLNLENLAGETALWIALRLEDDRTAAMLVELGTQLDKIVPIFTYSSKYKYSRSEYDLHKPGPIRPYQTRKETYLHQAAYYNCHQAVQAMLRRGMDPFALNGRGMTPADCARDNGGREMTEIFEEAREKVGRDNVLKEETIIPPLS